MHELQLQQMNINKATQNHAYRPTNKIQFSALKQASACTSTTL